MAQPTVSATDFSPTDEMVDRHREWVAEVASATWETWQDNGEVDRDPAEAHRLIKVVIAELMVHQREQWMHPLDSIATLASVIDDEIPTGPARLDRFDALRTAAGLGRHGRREWVARAMGTTPGTVLRYDLDHKPKAPVRRGRTSLYRHFDENGTLLYVGIARDPDHRAALHAHTARWYQYSTRCEVEWHETRDEALRAERVAIADEGPLFNISGSCVDPEDAEDYLLFRELAAAASR